MRIDSVTLKNIGPHRDLEVTIPSGLSFIVGANGAGKSTLVNSIYAALTGDFRRLSSTKGTVINNMISDGERSYIEVTGMHNNQDFLIRRSLKPNTAKFRIGGESFDSAKDINEKITEQLDIPRHVIDGYVFVEQWKMFEFITQTPAERAKSFQYLSGLSFAAEIHKACVEFVRRHEATVVVDNRDELTATLMTTQEEMQEKQAELESLRKITFSSTCDQKQKFLDVSEDLSKAESDAKKNKATAVSDRKYFNNADASYSEAKKLVEELTSVCEELDGPATEAADKLKKYSTGRKCLKDLQNARVQLLQKTAEWEDLKRKKEAADADKLKLALSSEEETRYRAEYKAALAEIQADTQLLNQLKKLSSSESAACPTCKQTIDASYTEMISERMSKNKAISDAAGAKIDAHDILIMRCEFADNSLADGEKELRDAEKSVAKAEEIVAAFSIVDLSNDEKQKLEDIVKEAEQKKAELRKATNRLSELASARSQAYGELKSSVKVLRSSYDKVKSIGDELTAVAAEFGFEGKTVDQVSKELTAQLDVESKISEAKNTIDSLSKSVGRLQALIKQLDEKVERVNKQKELLEAPRKVAEAFHWDALPRKVAEANMRMLLDEMNNVLSKFNDPFSVTVGEGLEFSILFSGRNPVDAKHISGGQKVMLSVAFRAALDRIYGTNIGMLFLDEPTAGLDSDNVDFFHEALAEMAANMEGRQIVVITHEQGLCDSFDNVIRLG